MTVAFPLSIAYKKFQDFPRPQSLISRTFQYQIHFPGLSSSWKF